jgi:hypothetical protein
MLAMVSIVLLSADIAAGPKGGSPKLSRSSSDDIAIQFDHSAKI